MFSIVPKNVMKNLLEAMLVVAFTGGAFMLILKVMDIAFPDGSPLIIFASKKIHLEGAGDRSNIAIKSPGEDHKLGGLVEVAQLNNIRNTVKRKAMGNIDWNEANKGDGLFDRDAIQTFNNSRASIEFDNESVLNMGENSLVIIKSFSQDFLTKNKITRMVLSKGRLYTELFGRRNSSMGMEISTDNFTAKIISEDPESPAKFKIHVNSDKSSTIAVYGGVATIQSGKEVVEVHANQALTVEQGQPMAKPVNFMGVLKTISPKNNGVFSYHDVPREINFVWKGEQYADSYTLVIARDAAFNDIITEERVEKSFFQHANLKSGKYYWKVRGNIGWVEGVHTAPQVINVVKDVEPPTLEVKMPPDSVTGTLHEISGATDKGTKIFVNNKPVNVSGSGEFKTSVELKSGTNIIVVEAVDSTGNVNYKTKLVNVKGI